MADEVVNELRRAARGGAIALVGMVVAAVFGFLVRAVIGRSYGPSDYGAYNLAFTVISITLVLVKLGFPMGLQRQVSYFLTKKPDRVGELISTAMITVTVTSAIGSAAVFIIRDKLPDVIGGGSLLPDLLAVLTLAVIPSGIFGVLIPISQGFKRVREYVIYTKIFTPVVYFLLTAIVAWVLKLSIVYVAASYVVTQVVALILLTKDLLQARILPTELRFSSKLARILIEFSTPLMLSNMVWFIMTWTDTLMLGHYLGSTIVGIYNAAAPLARFIPVFLSAFTVIYSPIVTSLHAREKRKEINRFYGAITKWIVLLTFPLFLLLFAYPRPTVEALFGKEYAEAWLPMMILSLGFMFHSAVGPNGLTIVSIGKPTREMMGNVIGAVLNVIINLLLIPRYGMVGAATATAVSYITANAYKQSVLIREGISPFNKKYFRVILAGTVITATAFVLRAKTLYGALLWTAVLSGGFYLLTLVIGAFDKTDIELLRMVSKRFNINLNRIIEILERFSGEKD